ncbi:MAG: response regulator [Bacteroidetes bacterium]|nr:response regulator [Bacteroidota bacterium]
MKINYKILWLDDKMDEILTDAYPEEIYSFLREQGFEPEIVPVKNEIDFFKQLDDSFDLILTDFHLNETAQNTRNGDKIIEEVRNRSIFSEIMFYSAQGEVADTIKKDRITFFDTRKATGKVHYEKIVEKAINLIGLTIRKFQHIIAMRGMIMHETSTLDSQMIEIINATISNQLVDFNTLSSTIYSELIELFLKKGEFVEGCRDENNFKKLSKDNFVFSAKYKIQTLSQINKSLEILDFSNEYETEINSIRNKFAHAILLQRPDGKVYFKHGDSGLEFNEDLCKKIRKDINKHKGNIEELKNKIDSKKN